MILPVFLYSQSKKLKTKYERKVYKPVFALVLKKLGCVIHLWLLSNVSFLVMPTLRHTIFSKDQISYHLQKSVVRKMSFIFTFCSEQKFLSQELANFYFNNYGV